MKKILVFAGSSRKDSVNKKLAAVAASRAGAAGAEVTLLDLADYPAPVYDGDIEEQDGLPATMQSFKALCASHDALIIVSPEYNGCIPPLLVNVMSWASRPEGDEASCAAFKGKKVAIAAASPGGLGGVRVIPRLRDFLAELSFEVVPGFATLPGAYKAFDDEGELVNETSSRTLGALVDRLLASLP
ncbi:NADPH-dependent FMN reductase [Granulosicoccus sp. 3-233]|uniref:NADPH-dependent FMN reductase n=1 Tax=Granulosicoccus sp. 3-233 TaxID=3417969 RepID=UPI003D33DE30